MNTASHILVIFLSVFLAVFMLLGIIVLTQVIRFMRSIQRIASRAENIIESAESVGTIFKNVSGPLALFKLIRNIVMTVKGKKL